MAASISMAGGATSSVVASVVASTYAGACGGDSDGGDDREAAADVRGVNTDSEVGFPAQLIAVGTSRAEMFYIGDGSGESSGGKDEVGNDDTEAEDRSATSKDGDEKGGYGNDWQRRLRQ